MDAQSSMIARYRVRVTVRVTVRVRVRVTHGRAVEHDRQVQG